jgi:hypothetical protein
MYEYLGTWVCDFMKDETFAILKEIYNTEIVPKDFQTSKALPLLKKLKTLKCEEHGTLSLISQAFKTE